MMQFEDTLVCHDCSWQAKGKAGAAPTLTFSAEVWAQWQALTRVKEDLEVLALFAVTPEGRVETLYVPEQEVESTACEIKEHSGTWDGMIHSHHSMGASFSQMDRNTVLPNYRWSVVTNHKGEYAAVERITLPCGGYGFRPCSVEFELSEAEAAMAARYAEACRPPAPKVQAPPVVVTRDEAPNGKVYHFPLDDGEWVRKREVGFRYGDDDGVGVDTLPEVVPACRRCEVYWATESPDACDYCGGTLMPVDVEWAKRRSWADVEEWEVGYQLDRA